MHKDDKLTYLEKSPTRFINDPASDSPLRERSNLLESSENLNQELLKIKQNKHKGRSASVFSAAFHRLQVTL